MSIFLILQVCVQDFAQKMLDWKAHGFPELGDLGGMGIGATTLAVLRDKTFVTDPHKVFVTATLSIKSMKLLLKTTDLLVHNFKIFCTGIYVHVGFTYVYICKCMMWAVHILLTKLRSFKSASYFRNLHFLLCLLAAFTCWENSGCNVAPNGGVMRTSVVGTNCWWDTEHVVKNALSFVKCTHHDPRFEAEILSLSLHLSLVFPPHSHP